MEEYMKKFQSGIIAGFVGTAVVCIMMMLQTATHQVPELHMVKTMARVLGTPDQVLVGLGAHFLIGTVIWGGLYALVENRIPLQSPVARGMAFGVGAWLAMMVIVMPLAGAGIFASVRGTLLVPLGTLVYHLVYGAVLGTIYASMQPTAQMGHHRTT
jgi:uncharacterized membrane protein